MDLLSILYCVFSVLVLAFFRPVRLEEKPPRLHDDVYEQYLGRVKLAQVLKRRHRERILYRRRYWD